LLFKGLIGIIITAQSLKIAFDRLTLFWRGLIMAKMSKGVKYSIWIAVVLVIAIGVYAVSSYMTEKNAGPGQYDDFAKCTASAGAFMYGTEWCPHCQNQKKMFGKSFQYVNYVDCDRNQAQCASQGVTGYPTWVFGDGTRISGTQSLAVLAQKTACTL
jgi:hypothetical protein